MATKADFTEDEWRTMQKGVSGAGMLVSVSDASFSDSFGESSALAKSLDAQQRTSDREFIRELAAIRGTGFGLTDSPQTIEAETLNALQTATATLAAKAPDELDPYRQLVLYVAEAVAEAKGGVKPGESAAMDKIRQALG
jgi:tellurite resistance protein